MIDISKFIYEKIANDSDIQNYTGLTIDWEEAKQGQLAPNLIINRISGTTNQIGRRIEHYQISVWETSKIKAEQLRNIVLNIFNRLKEGGVIYCNLENSISDYDKSIKEYGEHLTFKFKMLDKDF